MSPSTTLLASARPYAGTPKGETLWRWIGWAFVAYWILFACSSLTGQRELNAVGGIFVIAVLAWGVLERLWVKADAVVLASIAAMLLPFVQVLAGNGIQSQEAIFKHESLCAVMAMSRFLRLPAAPSSKLRVLFALPVLVILVLCLAIGRTDLADESRRAGLFVNPNNLALIPFLLLFFIDEVRDPLAIRLAVHAVIVAVLVFSGTSGAVMAYAIGMAVHLRNKISPNVRLLALTILLAASSVGFAVIALSDSSILPDTRLAKQLSIMRLESETVLQGGQINYYALERLLGPGATSGVWRLAHWRRTIATYLEGTPSQHLFGFGIGSSPAMLDGKLTHNDYLGVWFEQGLAGLLLFLFAWQRILKTAPASVRYVGLIVAIYSFSENNLYNFPFMSLLILFLSASEFVAPRGFQSAPLSQEDGPMQRSQARLLSI